MRPRGIARRWLIFNGVGVLGACIQLIVLAVLVAADVHYLGATAVAVEGALLHNLWWHERWTWSDRRAPGLPALLGRSLRFHLTNGGISIAGNLFIMRLLSGSFGFDPVIANIVAIGACSCLNFAVSDCWVFRAPSWPPGEASLS